MRYATAVVPLLLALASSSSGETAKAEYRFPGLGPMVTLEALPPERLPVSAATEAYLATWKRIREAVTWTLEQTGPGVYEVAVSGDLSILPVDRLLDLIAREHHHLARRKARRVHVEDLELRAAREVKRLRAVEERIEHLRSSTVQGVPPGVSREACTRLVASLYEDRLRTKIDLEATTARLRIVDKQIAKRRAEIDADPDPVLDALRERRLELESDQAGLEARSAALRRTLMEERARKDMLDRRLLDLERLEAQRDRLTERSEALRAFVEKLVTAPPGAESIPVRIDR